MPEPEEKQVAVYLADEIIEATDWLSGPKIRNGTDVKIP